MVVLADTLTTEEQTSVRGLYRNAGALEVSIFNFAVRFIQDRPSLQPDFEITDRDLDRLYESLDDSIRGPLDRTGFMKSSRYIRYDLEQKVALQKWGEAAEFLRRVPYDLQLEAALDLLQRADSPESLFQVSGQGPGQRTVEASRVP